MAEKLIHNSAEDVKKYIHGNHSSLCSLDYFICIGYIVSMEMDENVKVARFVLEK